MPSSTANVTMYAAWRLARPLTVNNGAMSRPLDPPVTERMPWASSEPM